MNTLLHYKFKIAMPMNITFKIQITSADYTQLAVVFLTLSHKKSDIDDR
jgi:hypothetical protein